MFFLLSALVGLVQVIEAVWLVRNRGRAHVGIMAASTIEFVWIFACLYVVFTQGLSPVEKLLPTLFLANVALTAVISIDAVKGTDWQDIQLKPAIVLAGFGFGAFYCLANLYVWATNAVALQ